MTTATAAQLNSMELGNGRVIPVVTNLRKNSYYAQQKTLYDIATAQPEYKDVEWLTEKSNSDSQCQLAVFAYYVTATVPAKDQCEQATVPPIVNLNLEAQAEWSRKHIFMKKYSNKNKRDVT